MIRRPETCSGSSNSVMVPPRFRPSFLPLACHSTLTRGLSPSRSSPTTASSASLRPRICSCRSVTAVSLSCKKGPARRGSPGTAGEPAGAGPLHDRSPIRRAPIAGGRPWNKLPLHCPCRRPVLCWSGSISGTAGRICRSAASPTLGKRPHSGVWSACWRPR